jgi:hypothetical protein
MKTIALLVGVVSGAEVRLHAQGGRMGTLAQDAAAVLRQVDQSKAPGDPVKQKKKSTERLVDVVKFSDETLKEAAKVSDEIKKEHAADLATLAAQLKAIEDAIKAFKNEGSRITYFFRTKEIALKKSHLACRRVQEGNCTNEKYTNEQLLIHEINMSTWEDNIQTEETWVRDHMCVQKDVNLWIVETVLELTGKLTVFERFETGFFQYREVFYSLVEATRQWRPWPAWQIGNETETNVTQLTCEGIQQELELASCARAAEVMKVNWHFMHTYQEAKGSYEKWIEIILEKAKNRKNEWIGVKTVECLLHRIHDHETSNEPCADDFQTPVTDSEIESCHVTAYVTTHLDIDPKPTPAMPPLYCIDSHPCTSNWMTGTYSFGYHDGADDLCRDLVPCDACVFTQNAGERSAVMKALGELGAGCRSLPAPLGKL